MTHSENVSKSGLKFLLSLVATSTLVATPAILLGGNRLLAQTSPAPTFALPSALPEGSNVRVDGSPSMATVVEALKQRYENRFPGSRLNFTAADANAALQSLVQGNTDVIVIGRALTDQEKAQGLSEVPLEREKIAIIVGADNPFKGSITTEQFAQIFRGELTNWSQLGGPDAPIRFIDRPPTSDTREALSRYPAFQQAPFQTGTTATQAAQDDTVAIARELGNDGISYAVRNQVEGQTGVQILPMHDTLPSDPRYPFSQPKILVYKGNPAPQILAFLSLATIPVGQEGTAAAPAAPAVPAAPAAPDPAATTAPAAPAPAASPEVVAPTTAPSPVETTNDNQGFPWWWLLLPLLGLAGLWALLRGRAAVVPPVADSYDSRIILTPRNCRNAYAFWEVSEDHKAAVRREGGRNLVVRLHDVTDISDMDRQKPHQTWQFAADEGAQDLHMAVARDDRDYIAELGYTTDDNTWLPLARSPHVRVPRCTQADYGPPGGASAFVKAPENTPVRVGASPQALITEPANMAANGLRGTTTAAVGTAAAAAATAMTATRLSQRPTDYATGQPAATPAGSIPFEMPQDCRIILVPRNSKDAYAYWEVAEKYRQPLREQGGKRLMLRIHDATNLDIDREVPHNTQTYSCAETDQDKHVTIPMGDRDYIADLGYLTDEGRWLRVIRSFHVHVPA